MMDQLIEKINQKDAFQIVRNTYVSLTIWIVAFSLLYFCANLFNSNEIKEFLIYALNYHFIIFSTIFAYHYAKQKKMDRVVGIIVGLSCSFSMVISFTSKLWLSIPSMIMISVILCIINWIKSRTIQFKSFPPAVSQYVENLIIPIFVFIILLIMNSIPNHVMNILVNILQDIVYSLSTLPAILLIVGLTCYFWYQGVHGVSILGTLLRPFWTQMILMNLHAILTNQEMLYIGSEAFYQWFVWIGGSGATLGLCIACCLFAKSKQMKVLRQIALSSGLFNINEQVIFGMPIMQNRYLRIPFYSVSFINCCIAYFVIEQGYVAIPHVLAPWVAPFFVGGILTSGPSINILLLILGLLLVSFFLYLPFFLWYDKKLKSKE